MVSKRIHWPKVKITTPLKMWRMWKENEYGEYGFSLFSVFWGRGRKDLGWTFHCGFTICGFCFEFGERWDHRLKGAAADPDRSWKMVYECGCWYTRNEQHLCDTHEYLKPTIKRFRPQVQLR